MNGVSRRVYVLPAEMVDRISAFQKDRRLPSEVEAVRRLLNEALIQRDTPDLIIQRIRDRIAAGSVLSSVAAEVLMGHPLVITIDQEREDAIGFTMRDGRTFQVFNDGGVREGGLLIPRSLCAQRGSQQPRGAAASPPPGQRLSKPNPKD